jgi:hypothetical protein
MFGKIFISLKVSVVSTEKNIPLLLGIEAYTLSPIVGTDLCLISELGKHI